MRPDTERKRVIRFLDWMDRPVDAAFLAVFRIAFGLLIALDVAWHFIYGFIRDHYIAPAHHFTYFGFGWVQPWPEPFMYLHFGLVGLTGIMIALGWHFRLATILFFTGFTYLFLVDQTLYLNHNYLISILGFLLMFLPAHRLFSLDARAGRVEASGVVPQWTLWILRAQIGIVYFFGGVAKINQDWLLGEPLRMWLNGRKDIPVIGPLLDTEFSVYFFSYGGLLYDLFIVPLLLWRRTRPLAVLMCFFFHLTNATLFDIGIFPWMMLAMTFIYFPPEQIGRWFRRPAAAETGSSSRTTPRLVLLILTLHLAGQCIFPFRHWAYPGDVAWTEEGHRFSWRMKLRSKQGWLTYRVVDPQTGRAVRVAPGTFATARQEVRMATRPDMILQGAHWLAGQGYHELGVRPRVYADAFCSLNGRAPRALIDPTVDLAAEPRRLGHARWITPFTPTPIRKSGTKGGVPTIAPRGRMMPGLADSPDFRAEVMTRLIAQQARQLDRINRSLRKEFGIDPEGYYTLVNRTMYALTPRTDITSGPVPLDVDDPASLRMNFTMREHRVLASAEQVTRYEYLATRKALLGARLELLAMMAPEETNRLMDMD